MRIKKDFVFWILKVLCVTVVVGISMAPFSCNVTEEGIVLISDEYTCPKVENFSVTGSDSCRLVFSQNVKLKNLSFFPEIDIADCKTECSDDEEGLCLVDFKFAEAMKVGENYRFYGEAVDRIGNSLTFSLPFCGYNDSLPELEITEVHPKYGSSTTKANGTVYKSEYVEFVVKKSGNLAGLELVSAYDGLGKVYKFPAIDVALGEVVVVHLRTKEGEGAVNELGTDFALSKGYYASDSARDLWDDADTSRLGDDMDVLLIRNSADEKIISGVCYASSSAVSWKNDLMKEYALSLAESGLWSGSEVWDAVQSDGLTLSKSMEKIAAGSGNDCWRVTASSKTNPGTVNME